MQRIFPRRSALRSTHHHQTPRRITWLWIISPLHRGRPRHQAASRGDQDALIKAIEAIWDREHIVADLHGAGAGSEAVPRFGRALPAAGGDLTTGLRWPVIERAVAALGGHDAWADRGHEVRADGGSEAFHQRPPGHRATGDRARSVMTKPHPQSAHWSLPAR
jgi:hypothetical protein